jgi:hypothetical protein
MKDEEYVGFLLVPSLPGVGEIREGVSIIPKV